MHVNRTTLEIVQFSKFSGVHEVTVKITLHYASEHG